jgi:hypothetical protein
MRIPIKHCKKYVFNNQRSLKCKQSKELRDWKIITLKFKNSGERERERERERETTLFFTKLFHV